LARETKQALAYAAISAALAEPASSPERRFDLLNAGMNAALAAVLGLVSCTYRGLDPGSFEPMFLLQGRELSFDALPTRVRHCVALVALAVRTLWAAYPSRDPRDAEGVITIDDVDLHQDTRAQQHLLAALRDALPEAQWIVTTASPIVAGSADARAVLALRPLPEAAGVDAVRVFSGDNARTH